MKTSKTKAFIEKAKIIHNSKYNYNKSRYINSYTKTTITCPIHGDFKQSPTEHYRSGCKKCAYDKMRGNVNEFIEKAINTHGNLYNYSKIKYINRTTKVDIVCKKHGIFRQRPDKHIMGRGCPICANINKGNKLKMSQEEFIKKSNIVHNNKYDYSEVNYIGANIKVDIICPKHGVFKQIPHSHLIGHGCDKCGKEITFNKTRIDAKKIISLFKKTHGDLYDYSKVVYINNHTPVTIICKEHGEFKQIPKNHINGSKCHKCVSRDKGISQRSTQEEFIEKANKAHGNIYDYSKVNYQGNKKYVIVICKEHGEFKVRPDLHINSKLMCPKCTGSVPEKIISRILTEQNISFIKEYHLGKSKYRYDFYLDKLNILIEYDGEHHFMPIAKYGGNAFLSKTIERDKEKNELANMYGIPLLRIPYTKKDELDNYVLYMISTIYKYCVNNKFYRNFIELCKNEGISLSTSPIDVKHLLTYNNA